MSYGYRDGKLSPRGSFTTDGRSEAQVKVDAEDAVNYADESPGSEVIRASYRAHVESARKSSRIVGPDVEHTRDVQAFEAAQKLYGYVVTIRALKRISPRARELSAAYWKGKAKR